MILARNVPFDTGISSSELLWLTGQGYGTSASWDSNSGHRAARVAFVACGILVHILVQARKSEVLRWNRHKTVAVIWQKERGQV